MPFLNWAPVMKPRPVVRDHYVFPFITTVKEQRRHWSQTERSIDQSGTETFITGPWTVKWTVPVCLWWVIPTQTMNSISFMKKERGMHTRFYEWSWFKYLVSNVIRGCFKPLQNTHYTTFHNPNVYPLLPKLPVLLSISSTNRSMSSMVSRRNSHES